MGHLYCPMRLPIILFLLIGLASLLPRQTFKRGGQKFGRPRIGRARLGQDEAPAAEEGKEEGENTADKGGEGGDDVEGEADAAGGEENAPAAGMKKTLVMAMKMLLLLAKK